MFPAKLWAALHFVGIFFVLCNRIQATLEDRLDPTSLYQPCRHHNPLMNPTHGLVGDVEVVWQIPDNPRAIVVLFPAMASTPLTFFDFGPNCKMCYGLPEERVVTLDALKRGYAVLALKRLASSSDADWEASSLKRWVPYIDIPITAVKLWTLEHHLETLPIVAWGHSAGGEFGMTVASTMELPVRAVVASCSIKLQGVLVDSNYPPIKFVTLRGNRYAAPNPTFAQVEEMIKEFVDQGVSASWITRSSKPLSPLYFAEHIHCMSRNMSTKLFEGLRSQGLLDAENFLTMRPLLDDFRVSLQKTHALPFCSGRNELCLVADVVQEAAKAFAVHAINSEVNDEIFSWLDSILQLDAGGQQAL